MELSPLRRASSGAMLGGVCAGLARRWQVDPTVLRIAMVLLCLIGGLGVAFYVGALLLVPKDGSTELPLNRLVPFTRSWSPAASIGAVVGLGVLITVLIGSWLPLGIAPAVGLGFLWYFGFYRRRHPHAPSGTSADDAQLTGAPPQLTAAPAESLTDFERAAAEWQQRVAEERWTRAVQSRSVQSPSVQSPPAQPPTSAPDVPRLVEYRPTPSSAPVPPAADDPRAQVPPAVPHWTPPLPRSARKPRPRWLWPLVLCLVGGGLATLAVLSTVFAMTVPPIAYAGTVLGALGLGLVLAAFAGRPRGLLPLSVLTGLVTIAMLLPMPRLGPVGDKVFSYTSTSQLPGTPLNHGAGDVALDLSALTITETRRFELDNGLGDVNVTLPATGNVVLEWKIGVGGYLGPDGSHDGFDLAGTYRRLSDPSAPTVTVVVKLGAGDLQVKP